MYTEEDEFNYDDYLEENDKSYSKKPFIDVRFILKVIFIIILLLLIIFLVFKIKNKNVQKNNNVNINNEEDVSLIFDNNMNMVVDAAHEYFFKDGNLPEKVGESKTITIKNLIDKQYISKVIDSKGYICGYNTSEASITRNKNDYKMEVKLICTEKSDVVVYYYDLDGKCLNCNGEIYNPTEETKQENPKSEDNKTDENKTEKSHTDEETKTPIKSCKDFSSWSTVYVAGNDYEIQTRTLVKGMKEEITYGNWSEPSTTEITATDSLEVKTYSETKTVESKTAWSKESTSKPKNKEGREISSRTTSKKYTTTSCTKSSTYTKILNKWDNSAYKCTTLGIGKVKCTYKTKGTCKTTTKYKKVKYYKYRDTISENITTTYYQSRDINKNILYTDYILESDMPEGYTKVDGSDLVQYRYREKCIK